MKRMAAAAAVTLILAGCGADVSDVVAETADNLEELRSGLLELRVFVEPERGGPEMAQAGFELIGSFQLPEEGGLPVADMEYTDTGADGSVTQGFISTGEEAFVEVDGQAYELPPDQTEAVFGTGHHSEPLFEGASIDDWFVDPELAEGESLDGEEVDRASGELDVVTALNDLFGIAQRFRPSAPFTPIEGEEAERLENAVRSSTMEIISGREDRLLRRLLIEVELAGVDGLQLAETLGPLAGTGFIIDMSISEPNQPIEVQPPTDALPLEALVAP